MSFEGTTTLEFIYWATTIVGGVLFIFCRILLFSGGELFCSGLEFDRDIDLGDLKFDLFEKVYPDSDINLNPCLFKVS